MIQTVFKNMFVNLIYFKIFKNKKLAYFLDNNFVMIKFIIRKI